jgi:hypothetical protein
MSQAKKFSVTAIRTSFFTNTPCNHHHKIAHVPYGYYPSKLQACGSGLTVQFLVRIGRAHNCYCPQCLRSGSATGYQAAGGSNSLAPAKPCSCFRLSHVRTPEVSETSFVHYRNDTARRSRHYTATNIVGKISLCHHQFYFHTSRKETTRTGAPPFSSELQDVGCTKC